MRCLLIVFAIRRARGAMQICLVAMISLLGWAEGRNLRIDYRWGGAEPERIKTYAIELVGLKPDVILAVTAQALQPLRQVTSAIPIVFTQMGDPIGSGFVTSLARPGGNITGFTPADVAGSRPP